MSTTPRSQELTEALSAMINQQPFFAVLAFNLLDIKECTSIPSSGTAIDTAATNGRDLFINPKFFKKLTVQERVFVLAHEVTHVILQHPGRMKGYMDLGFGPDMKPWQGMRFNKAADYVINSYLNELKVGHQPLGTLLNGQYGKDDLVDDVYCKLPEEEEDPNGGGSGQGWDQHLPSEGEDTGPSKPEIQRAVAMAAGAAKAQGSLPGALQRLVDEIIDPEIPWQDYLERTIVCLYGNEEASWARVNRRRLAMAPHIPWPGRVGNRAGNIALEIDTSGSIGQEELTKFLGVTAGVLKSVQPEKIYCMYVDAQLFGDVVEIDDVADLEHLKSKAGGGGGTDMTVVFREIEERQLEVEAVIVLTDGYTPFGDDCGIPTIWCITSPDIKAPWGTTIHVKLE